MPDVINSGSVYLIDTAVKKEIDGAVCEARVKKVVHINFSETSYTVSARMDKTCNDIEVEFIPESMDFLHELTDIFPLSEYDYKIIRPAESIEEHKPFISIEIQVTEKATGTDKWLGAESIILSDKDYDHFRNILLQAFPEHEWKSSDTYVKFMIVEYMNDWQFGLAADARDNLIGLVVKRYWC